MSPSKLKSSERQAARDRKASARQAASGGLGASAYNPSSGTFHTLEPLNSDTGAGYFIGRFKSIDDIDDNASSNGGVDVDCMSNNGSYSGESEDQQQMNGKDRNGSGKPGTGGGTDKRDKIRGKNERKHQRQKERRAQELRDKCNGYLMSRKLEALAQKLVAMGFSQERATMALIVNDGHVEQSVAWLLEGSEGQVHEDWNTAGNSKIDISEELGQILEIEKKYNFSRPDIERAVVACEGDLDKALEYLRARNQSTSPMRDEDDQSRSQANTKEEPSASLPTLLCSPAGTQPGGNTVAQLPHQDERTAVLSSAEGRLRASSLNSYASLEESSKGYAHVRKHPNPLTDPQSLVQRTFPSVSTMKSTTAASPFSSVSNVESGLVFGFGTPDPRRISVLSKDHAQNGPVKEPAYMGKIHSHTGSQPIVAPNNHSVSSPAFSPSSWSHGFLEGGSPSSVLHVNTPPHGDMGWKGTNASKNLMESLELGLSGLPHGDMGWKGTNASKNLMESLELGISGLPRQFSPFVSMQVNSQASQWNVPGKGLSNEIPCGPSLNNAAHSGSPTGTSYGLFTGWGARLSQSSVDWSTGPTPNCDYRNIDWSMNALPNVQGASSRLSSLMLQEKSSQPWSSEGERRFQTGSRAPSFSTNSFNGHNIRKIAPSGAGMQDIESGNATGHEWTSPFAGKALFNLPQAVSLPSL